MDSRTQENIALSRGFQFPFQVRTIEFWTFMLLVVLVFFPRVYIHYIGQWMMVNAAGFPPAKFEFLPWTGLKIKRKIKLQFFQLSYRTKKIDFQRE